MPKRAAPSLKAWKKQRPADECLLAAVVPVVIDAKAGKDPFLYGKLARTMGGFTSDDCTSRLVHLARDLHLDIRLADMNVREDDIAKMAEAYIGEEEEDAAASVSLNPVNELA